MATIFCEKSFLKKLFPTIITLIIICFSMSCAKRKLTPVQFHPSPQKIKTTSSRPYRVLGKTYYPISSPKNFTQKGIASWYGPKFHGKLTSNKERYDMYQLTAAHKTLPFDTRVRVTNLENGLAVLVRINDRGPFVGDRIIDLSLAAAKKLDMLESGTSSVELKAEYYPNQTNKTEQQPANKFGVQVGFFREIQNAKNLKDQTRESFVQKFNSNGNQFYRVVVGNYNQFDQAWNLLKKLKSNGFTKAFIIDY
jgi:rare lipoprotein A